MEYIVNVFLDKNAREAEVAGSKLAAHLWFKQTGQGDKGWVPVADPILLSIANDTVRFTLCDIYGDLREPKYKVSFAGDSPLNPGTATQLAAGTYRGWSSGDHPVAALAVDTPFVTSEALPLVKEGTFEFSVEVDDGDKVAYYLDPRMDVGP